MTDPAAPWWADVQHLRPDADRAREQHARAVRDTALEDVQALAAGDEPPRRRFARAAATSSAVATLDRTLDRTRHDRALRTDDDLDWAPRTDTDGADDADELPTRDFGGDAPDVGTAQRPAREWWSVERVDTDDWLALTEPRVPGEHRDPATGRRTVEIRGQVDGPKGVAQPDPEPTARATRQAVEAGDRGARRRARATQTERMYGRPDRIAMWAFVLGIVLILVALLGTPQAEAATRLGDRPLKAGMEGRDVRHLQLRLKRLGLLEAPATARFGALTKAAVKRYQRSRCLKADGIAGPATVRALRGYRRPCRGASKSGSGSGRSSTSKARAVYRHVDLGRRTVARGMRGDDVRTVQRLLGLNPVDGVFGSQTKRAVKRFQRRAGLGADGAVGPATRTALARHRMPVRRATFYGPGLFGRRTACGQTLTKHLHGVAHRTLPCGTKVLIAYNGRFTTARVVDRGPYANGAVLDLTAATARRVGLSSTADLRARY